MRIGWGDGIGFVRLGLVLLENRDMGTSLGVSPAFFRRGCLRFLPLSSPLFFSWNNVNSSTHSFQYLLITPRDVHPNQKNQADLTLPLIVLTNSQTQDQGRDD